MIICNFKILMSTLPFRFHRPYCFTKKLKEKLFAVCILRNFVYNGDMFMYPLQSEKDKVVTNQQNILNRIGFQTLRILKQIA